MNHKINIRPGVSVLSVLRHLNYKPWYALAEFVDNAVQSYIDHKVEFQRLYGRRACLKVSIGVDTANNNITIRDNAAGIHQKDYQRAFRAAEVPPDQTGLCEFGMGMKSAACWFAPRWAVRTKALGEKEERSISFDISKIVRDSIEELTFRSKTTPSKSHYTEIVLSDVYRMPHAKTLAKIRSHLASIYRTFTRKGFLELRMNGDDPLQYMDPKILVAPFYRTPKGKKLEWKKHIDVKLRGGRRAHGFAAIRDVGSTSGAGFSLFRRGRLIQGSADEGYRPEFIFGKSNSFIYQRLFGELHMEGFGVSHTKDGFRWDESEEDFLDQLRKQIDASPLPLLLQCREHRAKPIRDDLEEASDFVLKRTADVLVREGEAAIKETKEIGSEKSPPTKFKNAATLSKRTINIESGGTDWEILLETTDDESVGNWVDVFQKEPQKNKRCLGVRVSLVHPFTMQFAGSDMEALEPLVRLAAALGLAEVTARDAGVRNAGTVRAHLNELLREAFCKI